MHINDPLLNIRPESAQDADFLARLYRSTRDDLSHIGLPEALLDNLLAMQFNAQQSGYRTRYPEADFAIIEKNGAAIGCLITHRGEGAQRLINIALLPEARNQGHGRRLILALQAEAARAKQPLALAVSTQNTRAQRLYAALGFGVAGSDGAYVEMIWQER
jgi:ribosomal protein S18 acetylase RimI-like enzyme